jgi:hypothetical protein
MDALKDHPLNQQNCNLCPWEKLLPMFLNIHTLDTLPGMLCPANFRQPFGLASSAAKADDCIAIIQAF